MPEPEPDDHLEAARRRLLAAILPHVPFDGWSGRALATAAAETGTDRGLVRLAFPRGGLDALVYFHRTLDQQAAEWAAAEAAEGRIRDRVTAAVRTRISLGAEHHEAVHRGAALFALPHNATEGLRTLWNAADSIWTALGDSSQDYNWYTKRAILAGVLGATTAYWLGDDSEDSERAWAYLDRRIAGVMRFEKTKAQFRRMPFARCAMEVPNAFLRCFVPPRRRPQPGAAAPLDFPGSA